MSKVEIKEIVNKLVIKFPYNEELIKKVKTIPSAQWNKSLKQWEFPRHEYIYRQLITAFNLHSSELEQRLNSKIKISIKQHKFKTQPFQHQMEGVKFLLNRFGIEVVE